MVQLQRLPSGRIIEIPILERAGFYEEPSLDKLKTWFNKVVAIAEANYGGIANITPYFTPNSGSNLGLSILTSEVLEEEKLRIPTATEAMALHEAGMLDDRFLVDYGAVFYSAQGPNADSSKQIAEQIKKRGLETTVILHPADLKLGENGRTYELKDSPRFLIAGEEAQNLLKKIVRADSGFRRLSRDAGDWYADWDGLFVSLEFCRVVDRVRGEASATDLQAYENEWFNKNFDLKIKALKEQRAKSMSKIEAIFGKR